MDNKNQNTRRELEKNIIERAQDPTFRQTLLADPKTVLNESCNLTIPADIEIRIHEEDANHIHFVLPMLDGDELSDADLDAVAGGSKAKLPPDDCYVEDDYPEDGCGIDFPPDLPR